MGWSNPAHKEKDKMNDKQLDILLEEATDIKILIALG